MKTKITTIFLIFSIIYTALLHAQNNKTHAFIDIYGTSDIESAQLLQTYAQRITSLERAIINIQISPQAMTEKERLLRPLQHQKKHLLHIIKQKKKYAYVNIETTFYPGDNQIYTTMNVVKNSHLLFLPHQKKKKNYPQKNDLIQHMIDFQEMALQLMMKGEISPDMEPKDCPVHHCIAPFEHKKLQHFLQEFNTGVLKEKALVLSTLQHDPDPIRRAAASFLIGHLDNPQEILKILTPYIHDPEHLVRHHTCRVIGYVLTQNPQLPFNATPIIALLNSPFSAERNKALAILLALAERPQVQHELLHHAHAQLIALLKLKQPNQHLFAYQILKRISGKQYNEHDVHTWTSWLYHARHTS